MKSSAISATILFGAATLTSALPSSSGSSVAERAGTQPYAFANLIVRDDNPHELAGTRINVTMGSLYHNPAIVKVTSLTLADAQTNIPGSTINIDRVVCQRFKDQYVLQPGSVRFSGKDATATIATNPVELGWILCYTVPESE